MKKSDLEKRAERFIKKYDYESCYHYAMDILFLQTFESIEKNDEFKKIINSRKMLNEFNHLPKNVKQIVLKKIKQIDAKEYVYKLTASEILGLAQITKYLINNEFATITLEPKTVLYRVIKEESYMQYENPWNIPPHTVQGKGRFDLNQNILYVSTDLTTIEQECGLKKGDVYYLGRYEVMNKLYVGSFISMDYYSYVYQKICQAAYYKNINSKDRKLLMKEMKSTHAIIVPILIGILAGDKLYNYTNQIGDIVIEKNPDGIRYCSSYNTLESQMGNMFFTISDDIKEANYAITQKGYKKLKFIGAEKKIVEENKSNYVEELIWAINEYENKNKYNK